MRRMIGGWCVLFLMAGGLMGQETPVPVYTLEDCIRIGRERSVAAMNARRDQSIADAQIGQVRANVLPHLSVSGSYTRADELQDFDLGDGPVTLGSLDNYAAQGMVSQLLYSGGVKAALRAGYRARDYADAARLDTELALVRDIRSGFYAILLAQEAVKVRESSLAQFEEHARLVRNKFDLGTASEFEQITATVRVANEKPRLSMAGNSLRLAEESFRKLLNLEAGPFVLKGELVCEPVDWKEEALHPIALANSPFLRAVSAGVELKEEAWRAERGGALPSVRAMLRYDGANPYGFVAFEDKWEWHWSAVVGVTWDIWDGDLTRQAVKQKALELEKAEADREDAKRGLRLQVTQALLELRHAQEQVQSGKETVQLAERALTIARARHEKGLATDLDFAESVQALNEARLMQLSFMRDYLEARAKLEYAVGGDPEKFRKEERK